MGRTQAVLLHGFEPALHLGGSQLAGDWPKVSDRGRSYQAIADQGDVLEI